MRMTIRVGWDEGYLQYTEGIDTVTSFADQSGSLPGAESSLLPFAILKWKYK